MQIVHKRLQPTTRPEYGVWQRGLIAFPILCVLLEPQFCCLPAGKAEIPLKLMGVQLWIASQKCFGKENKLPIHISPHIPAEGCSGVVCQPTQVSHKGKPRERWEEVKSRGCVLPCPDGCGASHRVWMEKSSMKKCPGDCPPAGIPQERCM